jgi:hypothetical protein
MITNAKTIARMACRLSFVALALGLAACTLMAPPLPAPILRTAAVQEGRIERLRIVTQKNGSIRLGDARKTPGPGLYEAPSESEEILRMTQAVDNAVRGNETILSGGNPSSPAIGAVYLVRLGCGGVIYVFEAGPPRFGAGDAVLTDLSLSPSLSHVRR